MIIRYKSITHERVEDSPFIGALICAIDCNINCLNCFNQHMKDLPTIYKETQDIINEILANPFNKGIILGGLEWTLQSEEMKELIYLAQQNNLEVMLYTGLDENVFKTNFPDIYNLSNIYIKFGKYKEELKCNNNVQYGVKLASQNQKIIRR